MSKIPIWIIVIAGLLCIGLLIVRDGNDKEESYKRKIDSLNTEVILDKQDIGQAQQLLSDYQDTIATLQAQKDSISKTVLHLNKSYNEKISHIVATYNNDSIRKFFTGRYR